MDKTTTARLSSTTTYWSTNIPLPYYTAIYCKMLEDDGKVLLGVQRLPRQRPPASAGRYCSCRCCCSPHWGASLGPPLLSPMVACLQTAAVAGGLRVRWSRAYADAAALVAGRCDLFEREKRVWRIFLFWELFILFRILYWKRRKYSREMGFDKKAIDTDSPVYRSVLSFCPTIRSLPTIQFKQTEYRIIFHLC